MFNPTYDDANFIVKHTRTTTANNESNLNKHSSTATGNLIASHQQSNNKLNTEKPKVKERTTLKNRQTTKNTPVYSNLDSVEDSNVNCKLKSEPTKNDVDCLKRDTSKLILKIEEKFGDVKESNSKNNDNKRSSIFNATTKNAVENDYQVTRACYSSRESTSLTLSTDGGSAKCKTKPIPAKRRIKPSSIQQTSQASGVCSAVDDSSQERLSRNNNECAQHDKESSIVVETVSCKHFSQSTESCKVEQIRKPFTPEESSSQPNSVKTESTSVVKNLVQQLNRAASLKENRSISFREKYKVEKRPQEVVRKDEKHDTHPDLISGIVDQTRSEETRNDSSENRNPYLSIKSSCNEDVDDITRVVPLNADKFSKSNYTYSKEKERVNLKERYDIPKEKEIINLTECYDVPKSPEDCKQIWQRRLSRSLSYDVPKSPTQSYDMPKPPLLVPIKVRNDIPRASNVQTSNEISNESSKSEENSLRKNQSQSEETSVPTQSQSNEQFTKEVPQTSQSRDSQEIVIPSPPPTIPPRILYTPLTLRPLPPLPHIPPPKPPRLPPEHPPPPRPGSPKPVKSTQYHLDYRQIDFGSNSAPEPLPQGAEGAASLLAPFQRSPSLRVMRSASNSAIPALPPRGMPRQSPALFGDLNEGNATGTINNLLVK